MTRVGYKDDMYNLPREGPTEEIQAIRDFCADIYTYLFPERMKQKYRLHSKFLSSHFFPVVGDVILLYSRQCITFFRIRFTKDHAKWLKESHKAVMDYMEKIAKDILLNNTGSTVVFLLASMILELMQFMDHQGCAETIKYGACMYLSYILEKYCVMQWNVILKNLYFRNIATEICEKYFDKRLWDAGCAPVPPKSISWIKHRVRQLPDESFKTLSDLCAEPVLRCTLLGDVPTYEVSREDLKQIQMNFGSNFIDRMKVPKKSFDCTEDIEASFEAGDAIGKLDNEDVSEFVFGEKFCIQLYAQTTLEYKEKLEKLCHKIPSYINTRQSYKRQVESKVPIHVLRSASKLICAIEAASSDGFSLDSSRFFLDILEPCRSLQNANLSDQIKKISALSRQSSEIFLRIVTNTIHLCHKLYDITKNTAIKKKAILVQNIMFELIFDYKDTEMYSFPPMNFENDNFQRVVKKVMMCYFSLGHLHLLEVSINDSILEEQNLKEPSQYNESDPEGAMPHAPAWMCHPALG